MRRTLLVITFVLVVLSVIIGGHVYLAVRLVADPGLPSPLRAGLFILIAGLGATLLLQPIGERMLRPPLARLISWPASLWMGFAFLLLTLVSVSDVMWSLLGATTIASATGSAVSAGPARARALGVLSIALAGGLVGVRAAMRGPIVRRIEVRLARWPAQLDGFRIVQISDVHIGPILDRRFAAQVVTRCNALAPDLIAVTGDLVDGSVRRIADEVAPFADLRAPHGVFFVTGNHDHYSGADHWVERVEALGLRVLRNERVTIGSGAATFDLAGVEDHHAHLVSRTHREDLPRALQRRDPSLPVILLAHDPATFPQAARCGVDLQLSGHTHGGQIWPFRYLVRLSTPYVAGYYTRNGAQLYVSCGTGFWGPAMRLGAPAEITEIILRRA
jgi:predicted MPP superfamily phosphohydrolase